MSGKKIKIGKISGVTRRPIEYILVVILVLLISILVWSLSALNKDKNLSMQSNVVEGTVQEIDQLTENDILLEESIDDNYDIKYETSINSTNDTAVAVSDVAGQADLDVLSCDNSEEDSGKILAKIEEKSKAYKQALASQSEQISTLKNNYTLSLNKARSTSDEKRAKSNNLLVLKQPTDDLKTKAQQYAAHLDSAVSTRRSNYDTLIAEYQTKIAGVVTDKNLQVDAAINTFNDQVNTFISQVKKSCKNKQTSDQVKTVFQTSFVAAKSAYSDKIKAYLEADVLSKEAVEARKQSLLHARSEFEKSLINIKTGYPDLNS